MPKPGRARTEQVLSDDDVNYYVARLSKIAAECRRSGQSLSGKVMLCLSEMLGSSVAQAVIYYVDGEGLADPRSLVEGLVRLFHQGASVILAELVKQAP